MQCRQTIDFCRNLPWIPVSLTELSPEYGDNVMLLSNRWMSDCAKSEGRRADTGAALHTEPPTERLGLGPSRLSFSGSVDVIMHHP